MSVKKYFWLRMKEDFFHDPKIKKLRRMAGGDTYTIILQKIMLLSIKDGGIVEFQGIEKTLHEELALILDEDVINVEAALSFMRHAGFIEPIEEDRFLLPLVPQLIGSESDSAERVRKLREKRKSEPPELQCNGNVTGGNKNVTTEKEKELERDIDLGGNARVCEPLGIEKIAVIHSLGVQTLYSYIHYRTESGGIHTPPAFQRSLLKDLYDPESAESSQLGDWLYHLQYSTQLIETLSRDFASLAYSDRVICRELANDFKPQPQEIVVEMAFQRAVELRASRGSVA